MRGRKPKPAAERALHHSEDRAPHREPPAEAPIPARAVLAPPVALELAARPFWEYFAGVLASARLLTDADLETLADYCRACAAIEDRSKRLWAALEAEPFNDARIRLLDNQTLRWIDKKTRLAHELGLTAAGRAKLGWTGQRAPAATVPASDPDPGAEAPRSKLLELQARGASLRRQGEVH